MWLVDDLFVFVGTTPPPFPFDKEDVIWIVVLAFIISFILGVALGANDVANSFGTSVGAKVLTLYQACFIAAIFETGGAMLMGYKVSDTIRKGLFDPLLYEGYEELLMIGNLCALAASCIWLFVATGFRIPVSATHSIVGASLGFHLVAFGGLGVNWRVVILIILSWFCSPAISGAISSVIFTILNYSVLKSKNQLRNGLISLPFWYFLVFFVNMFSIFYGSSEIFKAIDELWETFAIAIGTGVGVAILVIFILIPVTRKRVLATRVKSAENVESGAATETKKSEDNVSDPSPTEETDEKEQQTDKEATEDVEENDEDSKDQPSTSSNEVEDNVDDPKKILCPDDTPPSYETVQEGKVVITEFEKDAPKSMMVKKGSDEWNSVKDTPEVRALCAPMQVMSACFAAFTHGGNDVSNCIGPLVSLWIIFTTGEVHQNDLTPFWILFYGAAGISFGLFVLGRRVIQTVGEDLTPMTPSNGFAIELGSATTVLIASNLGVPISTTHCQVGSVCATGFVRTRRAVDWRLFSGIFSAWVVTLPITILLSGALFGLLQHVVPNLYPHPVWPTHNY
ncbi:sodium-dependent phosphate transporter 1-B-like [Amphiura filiformis]|uniref:sodium-dependent phosphate transporter 1-B-like n=1 Tax=Amphiura filiformis TaxID=82378 RepID=UPI003B219389